MKRLLRVGLTAAAWLTLLGACCFDCPVPCTSDPTAPGCAPPPAVSGAGQLNIVPIAQQTEVWCWAATAEMVFRYYGLPNLNGAGNYQCGIVAAYFQGQCLFNCGLCVVPIGGMTELQKLVLGYGAVARQVGVPSRDLQSSLVFRALQATEVKTEIDAGRPVIAGISAGGFPFPNFSQHVVLVTGYDATATPFQLIVNDPFPYDLPAYVLHGNPYLQVGAVRVAPGRYRISYSSFVGPMAWGNSIYQISLR